MKSELYLDSRVSHTALNRFLSHFTPGTEELHTLEVTFHGARVITLAPAPYSTKDKREIYSLSKSFCSTAVGILVTEGKLHTDDRIVDIFPDKLPEKISENLSKMRLSHVLSMNTGHPSCVMPKMIRAKDAAEAFLAQEVPFEPGTHFAYNTGATCMLSCIVERITGMKLVDFLTVKLFLPLGIEGIRWNRVNSGANEGGCGIHVSCDDITKLGLLYLNDGVWNGRRILSHEWVAAATSPISDNSMNGSPDWCAGYGYQFWHNAREGFRGDGAYGQLCFVLPEHDMIFAVQTELGNMQAEIDAIMEFADTMFMEEDAGVPVQLPVYAPASTEKKTSGLENRFWKPEENPFGFTGIYMEYSTEDDSLHLIFSEGAHQWVIRAGNGEWVENTVFLRRFKPKLVGLMSTDSAEACRFSASYHAENGQIQISMRYLNCPHRMSLNLSEENGLLTVNYGNRDLLEQDARKITAQEIRYGDI